jgi:hypothetical protein
VTNKTYLRFATKFRRGVEIAVDDILPAKQPAF